MRYLKSEISDALIWIFIQDSVNSMRLRIPSSGYRKVYWEFYYVQTNVMSSIQELSRTDIDADFLRFPQIQKNNRIAIEAAIDLFNLCRDPDYISVICDNARIRPEDYARFLAAEDYLLMKHPEKYHRFREKTTFYTLSSKLLIAKKNGLSDERFTLYKSVSQESNHFMHPNVFLSPMTAKEKDTAIRNFLNLNLTLLLDCYHDLCVFISNGWIFRPCSLDHKCHNDCLKCYQVHLSHIQMLLNGELFHEV